jgi:hypothetical protein
MKRKICVYVSEDLVSRLAVAAEQRGATKSGLVGSALDRTVFQMVAVQGTTGWSATSTTRLAAPCSFASPVGSLAGALQGNGPNMLRRGLCCGFAIGCCLTDD